MFQLISISLAHTVVYFYKRKEFYKTWHKNHVQYAFLPPDKNIAIIRNNGMLFVSIWSPIWLFHVNVTLNLFHFVVYSWIVYSHICVCNKNWSYVTRFAFQGSHNKGQINLTQRPSVTDLFWQGERERKRDHFFIQLFIHSFLLFCSSNQAPLQSLITFYQFSMYLNDLFPY